MVQRSNFFKHFKKQTSVNRVFWSAFLMKKTVLKTDTGKQVEYTKALEITLLKELGNLTL